MHFDLTSTSDASLHCLYDPGAVLHVVNNDSFSKYDEAIRSAKQGDMVIFDLEGSGELCIRIYVDEPLGAGFEGRLREARKGHLRVPTGRLFQSGLSEMRAPRGGVESPGDYTLRKPSLGMSVDIPPGIYDVESSDVDDEEHEEMIEAPDADAVREAHPVANGIAKIDSGLYPVLFYASLIAFIGLLFSPAWALANYWPCYVGIVVIWALHLWIERHPAIQHVNSLRRTVLKPNRVVVLRRRESPPNEWRGVLNGVFPDWEPEKDEVAG